MLADRSISSVLLILFSFLLSGCSTVHYFFQAGKGQMALVNRARPIDEVLRDERTEPHVKRLLSEVSKIKKFGEEKSLKPTQNYDEFVDLGRPAVVWVVSACEPLQFKSKLWKFPLVGSFNYLGWFSEEDAKKHAERLKKEGWEVYLRGASAYSTLGWFKDPVLSSMLSRNPTSLGYLVNVILHESVHTTLYFNDQSYFNESLANFVADKMTLTYLDQFYGKKSSEKKIYLSWIERAKKRSSQMRKAYEELDSLFKSDLEGDQKKTQKEKILSQLRSNLKIKGTLNNARLIQYKTYESSQGDFESLYQSCGSNWERFFQVLQGLEEEDFGDSQQKSLEKIIRPILRQGCTS